MERELFEAISSGDTAAVERILGANPALVTARNAEGVSVLMLAAYTFNPTMKKLILSRLPELDIFEATIAGDADRVGELLRAEPGSVTAYSPDGFTLLHFAGFFNHPDVARLLLAAGASVSAVTRNAMANQPLHAAAAGRSLDVCRQVLEAGADPNATQHGGFTPIHEAAHHGNVRLVELLLQHGVDTSALTDEGKSAVDLAREHDHADVVAILDASARVRS